MLTVVLWHEVPLGTQWRGIWLRKATNLVYDWAKIKFELIYGFLQTDPIFFCWSWTSSLPTYPYFGIVWISVDNKELSIAVFCDSVIWCWQRRRVHCLPTRLSPQHPTAHTTLSSKALPCHPGELHLLTPRPLHQVTSSIHSSPTTQVCTCPWIYSCMHMHTLTMYACT